MNLATGSSLLLLQSHRHLSPRLLCLSGLGLPIIAVYNCQAASLIVQQAPRPSLVVLVSVTVPSKPGWRRVAGHCHNILWAIRGQRDALSIKHKLAVPVGCQEACSQGTQNHVLTDELLGPTPASDKLKISHGDIIHIQYNSSF